MIRIWLGLALGLGYPLNFNPDHKSKDYERLVTRESLATRLSCNLSLIVSHSLLIYG